MRHHSRFARVLAAAAIALMVLSSAPAGSAAGTDVGAAQAALAAATEHRVATEARLAAVEAEAGGLRQELDRLESGAAQLTEELAAARRAVREYAVAAYIDGGQAALLAQALEVEEGNDRAWRAQIMGSQTSDAGDAIDRFEALKAANEPDRIAAAARLDELDARLTDARNDLIQASAHERDAEAAVARARDYAARQAAQATQAARSANSSARISGTASAPAANSTASSSSGAGSAQSRSTQPAAPSGATGNPTAAEAQMLAKIRHCESRGNYSIVSSSGKYRGAYQFDRRTWQGVGGAGDPAAASPAEQDYRALILYRQRGRRPWPNCA